MTRIVRSALVPYPPERMYALVHDVEAYPEFLPWCETARVDEQSASHQIATVAMSKSIRRSRFTTRNRLEPGRAIHLGLIDGPFRRLEGVWRFVPVGAEGVGGEAAGCRVELEIEFEFAGRVLSTLLGPAFTRVCDTLVDAFVRRARTLYGGGAA